MFRDFDVSIRAAGGSCKSRIYLLGKINHPHIQPVSRAIFIGEPPMNGQHYLVRLRLIGERFVSAAKPQQLGLAIALADIRTQPDERLIDLIVERIRLLSIAGAFKGDRPLVICFGGSAPGAVSFLHAERNPAVRADTIITVRLSGFAGKTSANALR